MLMAQEWIFLYTLNKRAIQFNEILKPIVLYTFTIQTHFFIH